jgi:hypothetical protein
MNIGKGTCTPQAPFSLDMHSLIYPKLDMHKHSIKATGQHLWTLLMFSSNEIILSIEQIPNWKRHMNIGKNYLT